MDFIFIFSIKIIFVGRFSVRGVYFYVILFEGKKRYENMVIEYVKFSLCWVMLVEI